MRNEMYYNQKYALSNIRCDTCNVRMSTAEVQYCQKWNNNIMQCKKHQTGVSWEDRFLEEVTARGY